MQLYHLTLRQSGQVEKIAYGSFSGAKRHELAVISGSRVRLYAVASVGDSKTRRLVPKCSVDCFARMQSIQAVRVPGAKTDRILLSSDAGRLVLLKAVISDATGALTLVSEQCETYGKSGMRRDVPAKHMAVDPKGRAVMIAAIEAKKLVYVLGRTAESENITLSSPIEAHRPDHVVIDVVACDAGYGNPLFAVLEQQNYASNAATSMAPISQPHLKSRALGSASLPPKVLTLYELDLGINHVRRRKSILVNPSSHKLIPLPGAPEGPGGVLVCSFGRVSYYTLTAFDEDGADGSDSQSATLVCQIPLRNESDTADIQAEVLISAYALHRQRGMFFLLMANEFGDLLKLDFTLSTATAPAQVLARDDPPASVTATQMSLYYYDSLPGPTLDFVITKNGCLFNASEAGDHGLYLIQSLEEADNVEDGICTSAHGCLGDFDTIIPPTLRRKVFFDARRALRNLLVLDRLESLAPLLRPCAPNSDAPDLSVVQPSGEPETESDQISKDACIVAGAGSRRLVRLHRSLAVTELAVSELPARALNAFSLQLEPDGEDRFVLVSFANATLPLQVGESIQEATAVPFVKTERTLAACTLYDGKMIQVHRLGFCVIQAHAPAARSAPAAETDVKQNGNDTDSVLADANEAIVPATASVAESVSFTVAQDHLLAPKNRATDKYPEEPSVLQAAVSASQLILVTNKKQLMYFILDPSSGQMRLASRMDLVSSESVSDEKSDNAVSSICLPGTAHVLAGSQDLSASVPLALSLACNTSAPSDTYAGLCAVALGRSLRVLKLTPSAGDVRSNSSARLITPTALQMLPADVSDVTFIPLQGGDFAMLAATRAGSVVYSTVDHVSGTISGRFARLLGTDAVHFFDVRLVRAQLAESVFSAVRSQNQPHMYRPPLVVAVCGSSGTSWLVRNITSFGTSAGGLLFSPLRGVHMERGCSFASSHISPGGLVGVHKGKLLIAVIDEIEGVLLSLEESTSEHAAFHATFASAQHTVRRVLSLGQKSGHESSQRAGTRNAQSHLGASLQYVVLEADPVHRGSGGVTTKAGALASRVRLLSMSDEVEEDMPALSAPFVSCTDLSEDQLSERGAMNGTRLIFWDKPNMPHVCVSLIGADTNTPAVIRTYKVEEGSAGAGTSVNESPEESVEAGKLALQAAVQAPKSSPAPLQTGLVRIHDTVVEGVCNVLCEFGGRLLAGVGRSLLLFDLGRKKLLKKCETAHVVQHKIVDISPAGGCRLFVADVQSSVSVVEYDPEYNVFLALAGDPVPRYCSSILALDYCTVAVGDKFGNVAVLSIPISCSAAPMAAAAAAATMSTNNCLPDEQRFLLTLEACFHVGSVVTGLLKMNSVDSLLTSGNGSSGGVLVYTLIDGTVGALLPFDTKQSVSFMANVERAMRERRELLLAGRDHLAYRSSFYPVKHVIDGDLCELFASLSPADQAAVASKARVGTALVLTRLQALRLAAM